MGQEMNLMRRMVNWNEFLFKILKGKKLRFKCECLIPFDIEGGVIDYKLNNNEYILVVDVNGKIIQIGTNTPSLKIEEV